MVLAPLFIWKQTKATKVIPALQALLACKALLVPKVALALPYILRQSKEIKAILGHLALLARKALLALKEQQVLKVVLAPLFIWMQTKATKAILAPQALLACKALLVPKAL